MRLNVDWLPNWAKNYLLRKKLKQVEQMARAIHDNKQFRDIIMGVKPGYRRVVYEQLSHLLKFKPKPYMLLIR